MNELRSLVDICIAHIQVHAHLLADHKVDEQVIKLIANKQGFNIAILQSIDQRHWINSIDLKASNITDEGLAKISGMFFIILISFLFISSLAIRGLSTLNISDCSHVSDFGILKLSGHENLCIIISQKIIIFVFIIFSDYPSIT